MTSSVPVVLPTYSTVFVYGSLKRDGTAGHLMQAAGGRYVGSGYTAPWYQMKYWQTEKGYPVLLYKDDQEGIRAQGELFRIPTGAISDLDNYEGPMYFRCKIPIWFYFGGVKGFNSNLHKTEAWTYLGVQDDWKTFEKEKTLLDCPIYTRNANPRWEYASFTPYLVKNLGK